MSTNAIMARIKTELAAMPQVFVTGQANTIICAYRIQVRT